MDAVPTLVGIAGHMAGETFPLEYGKKVVIGRSRSADWSLVKLKAWADKSTQEQAADDSFRTISGRHFEITMYNLGSIELVNISSNGTRLDGKPLDRSTVTDVSTNTHEIAFGVDEVLRLELRPPAEGGAEGKSEPEASEGSAEKPESEGAEAGDEAKGDGEDQ